MYLSFTRSPLVLCTLLTSMSLDVEVYASTGGGQEIPVKLVRATNGPAASPPPNCSICDVEVNTSTETPSTGAGLLDFEYDDESGRFQGQLRLVILLQSGAYTTHTIDDVDMDSGETSVFDLEPGADWTWTDDVDQVFVRMIPDPS